MNQIAQTTVDHETACELDGTREMAVLLLCARSRSEESGAEVIRDAVRDGVRWDFLAELAQWHGIDGLLYRTLSSVCPGLVPRDTRDLLYDSFEENAHRFRRLCPELTKLMQEFQSAQIPALPFKGPVLAHLFYRSPETRRCFNLDILIREDDLPRAQLILLNRGFQIIALPKGTSAQAHWHLESRVGFQHGTTGTQIVLHHQIVPRRYGHRISFDGLWERRHSRLFGDTTLSVLSPEDHLVVLALHAIKNGFWPRMSLVCDFAELLASNAVIDWKLLFTMADESGTERTLMLGLALAQSLLGTRLPAAPLARIAEDAIVGRLAERVQVRLMERQMGFPNLVEATRMHLSLRKRLFHKAGYVFCIMATPSDRNLTFFGAPVSLSQSYVVRQLTLAKKCARQIIRVFSPR